MKISLPKFHFHLGFWSGLFFFFIAFFLPTSSEFTVAARNMLAVTMLMAIWWMSEALPLGVTALLPLVCYPILGIMKTSIVSGNYTNHLVFLFLGGFIIASAIQKWQLHRRFALFTISLLGANTRKIVLAFMLSSAVLSMWISNTATALMMLPIAISVIQHFRDEHIINQDYQNKFAIVLLLGIAYASSIGGMATLIGTPPNIIFSGIYEKYFPELSSFSFIRWSFYILPLSAILFSIIWLYLAFIILYQKVVSETHSIQYFKQKYKDLGSLNKSQKKVLIVFLTTAFLWIFRTEINLGTFIIPGWPSLLGLQDMIQDSTIAIGMAILLYIIPSNEKRKKSALLELRNLLEIPWDILLLFGGGFALADGIQKTGLAAFLGQQLQFTGELPLWVMLFAFALSIALFTEITSNTAVATTFLPITAGLAINLNMNPLIIMLPVTIASSCAFMLPVSTPPNAIVFGTRLIPIKEMVKIGAALNVLVALIISFYFYELFHEFLK